MCGSVVFLFLIYLYAGSSLACDTNSILQCQQTFLSALGFSGDMSQDTNVMNGLRSTERINLLCTSFQAYKQCAEPLWSICSDDRLARIWSNTKDMYTYICDTGRADIVRYADCWNTDTVLNEANQCAERYTLTTNSIQDICNYVYNILTCTGDVVYNHCGAKPATVYSTIMSSSLQITVSATHGSCQNIKQTFGTVGKNPYENGRVPSNASTYKPMNYAYVTYIVTICLFSLLY